MKIGLYSVTFLGMWYRGKELTLPEMIAAAKTHGYDGIEIDGKRPHTAPVIVEVANGTQWSVDQWTRAYGQSPEIMTVSEWKNKG